VTAVTGFETIGPYAPGGEWTGREGEDQMLRLVSQDRLKSGPQVAGALVGAAAEHLPDAVIAQDFSDPFVESVRLLREASEIEHALMAQYLYAAFSVRPKYAAIVGPAFSSSKGLLGVAIQEMEHLAIVNRTLSALGAEPNLRSQDFPYEIQLYPFPMNLERLTLKSLAKYVFTEAPAALMDTSATNPQAAFANAVRAQLDGLRPNHIGSIYRSIIGHLQALQSAPPFPLPDLSGHIDELTLVLDQGEEDHCAFFRSLFEGSHTAFGSPDVWRLDPADPDYPSMPVPLNPSAVPGHPNELPDGPARRLGWISNLHYWAINILVDLNLRSGRATYMTRAKKHMIQSLQKLGRHLAAMGAGAPFDPLSTGYAPGSSEVGTRRFLRQLLKEAARLEAESAASLPPDYGSEVASETILFLEQLGV
jgi:hypothetical protein